MREILDDFAITRARIGYAFAIATIGCWLPALRKKLKTVLCVTYNGSDKLQNRIAYIRDLALKVLM